MYSLLAAIIVALFIQKTYTACNQTTEEKMICPINLSTNLTTGRCAQVGGTVLCSEETASINRVQGLDAQSTASTWINNLRGLVAPGENTMPRYARVGDAISGNGPSGEYKVVSLRKTSYSEVNVVGRNDSEVQLLFFAIIGLDRTVLYSLIKDAVMLGVEDGLVPGCKYDELAKVSFCGTFGRPKFTILYDVCYDGYGMACLDEIGPWCESNFGCEYYKACAYRGQPGDSAGINDFETYGVQAWGAGICKPGVVFNDTVMTNGAQYFELRELGRPGGGRCRNSWWRGNAIVKGVYGHAECGFGAPRVTTAVAMLKRPIPKTKAGLQDCSTSCPVNFYHGNSTRERREVKPPSSMLGQNSGFCALICFGAGSVRNGEDEVAEMDDYWTARTNDFSQQLHDELESLSVESQSTRDYVNNFTTLTGVVEANLNELNSMLVTFQEVLRSDFLTFDQELRKFAAVVEDDRVEMLIAHYNQHLETDYIQLSMGTTINLIEGNYHVYANGCISFLEGEMCPPEALETTTTMEQNVTDDDNSTESTERPTLPPMPTIPPAPMFTRGLTVGGWSVAEILLFTMFWLDVFQLIGNSIIIHLYRTRFDHYNL